VPLSPGQLVRVVSTMDAYLRLHPGTILTILSSSLPTFHNDDTWYVALAPDGSTVWLIDRHKYFYYETT
jgi:hypothetical protein